MSEKQPAAALKVRYPRFCRTDRFPTSCSVLSALSQLDQLGVKLTDIRLVLEDRRRHPRPQILEQEPAPGTPIKHGTEVSLRVAVDGILSNFPEGLFVSEPGREGRDQLDEARRFFAPFDKAGLVALSGLRYWNVVFSGAQEDQGFESFIFEVLGLGRQAWERSKRIFRADEFRAWTHILPLLSRMVGDPDYVRRILNRFLGDEISIAFGPRQTQPVPLSKRFRLEGAEVDASAGQGSALLGKAFLGSQVQENGKVLVVRIGPLSPDRIRRYEGLSFVPASGSGSGTVVVDLGPVCELNNYWGEWEKDQTAEPGETEWPKLIYLLQYLLPAHLKVEVHLEPEIGAGWKLGQKEAVEGFFPSTLGAWTILRSRPAVTSGVTSGATSGVSSRAS